MKYMHSIHKIHIHSIHTTSGLTTHKNWREEGEAEGGGGGRKKRGRQRGKKGIHT
jgi:hypothetical protein